MITALIIGFITGWLISMPIGPVNAAAISRTLKYNFKSGIATGLGAALMDFLYCAGAAQIHQFLLEFPLVNLLFRVIGFAALLWLGIRTLKTRTITISHKAPETEFDRAEVRVEKLHVHEDSLLGAFMVGVVLYASNVAAVPEWIFVSALWRTWGLLETGVSINLFFALGAGLGTAGWFTFLVRFIAKRQHGFAPETLRKINLGAGAAMLLFGAYFCYQIAFDTNWSDVTAKTKQTVGNVRK